MTWSPSVTQRLGRQTVTRQHAGDTHVGTSVGDAQRETGSGADTASSAKNAASSACVRFNRVVAKDIKYIR